VAAWLRDPGELLEEGDHVHEDDEVERRVLERQRARIADLKADPAGQLDWEELIRVLDHLWREVDADNLRSGEAPGDDPGRLPRPGAKIEHPPRGLPQGVERGAERDESFGPDSVVPARGERIELPPEGASEDPPQARSAHDRAGRHPREALL
jgi:hypothetical protein